MWAKFVVGSFSAPRGFPSGTPVFPSPKKPTLPPGTPVFPSPQKPLNT